MDDLVERTRMAAKILRDLGGQSVMTEAVDEAAVALEAAWEDVATLNHVLAKAHNLMKDCPQCRGKYL